MSCTVVALPYALMWVVGAIATAAASTAVENKNEDFFDFEDNNINENCTEDRVITEKHFIEKNFETPFMDKEILMKTLEEHGVRNIFEWESGISGEVENYKLTFEKPSADKPYNVRISCLNGEYALNVQEDAYLHILDKLKENNMQIEQEEVMDDNTIVLTVNID